MTGVIIILVTDLVLFFHIIGKLGVNKEDWRLVYSSSWFNWDVDVLVTWYVQYLDIRNLCHNWIPDSLLSIQNSLRNVVTRQLFFD